MQIIRILLSPLLFLFCLSASSQVRYKYPNNESFTYEEAVEAYGVLAEEYAEIELIQTEFKTDVGRPLHLAVFNHSKKFKATEIDRKKQVVVFINNAIHPGESCGVDATVKLFEQLGKHHKLYENVVVVAIPVYNIGGMLNRSPYNRSGQPGPVECGFRGNYQHLDLNRDFIKTDSKNALGFAKIYQRWQPNLFMDTHTTNGSDHQYTVTLITSQLNKMNPVLREYVSTKVEPYLFKKMKESGKEMVPYVYSMKGTPESGIKDFMETPRYSSGYANLFNSIAFISEAHKYKTFTQRVEHTNQLLDHLVKFAQGNSNDLIELKKLADEYSRTQPVFGLNWKLDTSKYENIDFNGYKLGEVRSEVTGQMRRQYNRDKPVKMKVRHYRTYTTTDSVRAPEYYILPQAYPRIAELLKANGVEWVELKKDSVFRGEMYRIEKVASLKTPYEKHFMHEEIEVSSSVQQVKYYKGDLLISTRQPNRRFIVEVLEPHASDSYFRWNFFDNVLQQKEWFSDFAFDPIAASLLEDDENLRKAFNDKQQSDTTFANNHFQQLQWIFVRSPYYEKTHRRYPVMRYTP